MATDEFAGCALCKVWGSSKVKLLLRILSVFSCTAERVGAAHTAQVGTELFPLKN